MLGNVSTEYIRVVTVFMLLAAGILVRDNKAVEKLRKEVGDIGLIM